MAMTDNETLVGVGVSSTPSSPVATSLVKWSPMRDENVGQFMWTVICCTKGPTDWQKYLLALVVISHHEDISPWCFFVEKCSRNQRTVNHHHHHPATYYRIFEFGGLYNVVGLGPNIHSSAILSISISSLLLTLPNSTVPDYSY
eukprot:scaffold425_cov175-Amphora_coffeaeformis.AAC.88